MRGAKRIGHKYLLPASQECKNADVTGLFMCLKPAVINEVVSGKLTKSNTRTGVPHNFSNL